MRISAPAPVPSPASSASSPSSAPSAPSVSSASASSAASGSSAPSASSSAPSAPPSSPPPPGFATGFGAGYEPGYGAVYGSGFGTGYEGAYDGGATAAAELCPQCGTPREGAALFCEECRYNFGTHSPSVTAGPPPPLPQPSAPGYPPYQRHESERSRPSQVNRAAEPVPSESLTLASGSGDFLLEPPSTAVGRDPASSASTSVTPKPASVPTVVPPQPVPPGAAGTAWVAVVGADREYFAAMMARSGPEAEGLYFPAYSPEVQVPLTGNQITIGRRRHSTGEAPDIDLSRAPEDPGVSHQHAVLVQQPDGNWSVVDQDSTNGTTVNLGEEPIRPYTPVPLGEGDRVHVGAWTTITVRRV